MTNKIINNKEVLQVQRASKSFGGLRALRDFSITLRENESVSLIGPNGAGKTTVFEIISGFVHPDFGHVWFNNVDLTGLNPFKIARRGIFRSYQDTRIYRSLTVQENVILAMPHFVGLDLWNALFRFTNNSRSYHDIVSRAEAALEATGIYARRRDLAGSLSFGQQKLLMFACCIASESQLLLLDEPTAGVQPNMIDKIVDLMRAMKVSGRSTLLLIEHNLAVVRELSDRVVLLANGETLLEGTSSEVLGNQKTRDAFLR